MVVTANQAEMGYAGYAAKPAAAELRDFGLQGQQQQQQQQLQQPQYLWPASPRQSPRGNINGGPPGIAAGQIQMRFQEVQVQQVQQVQASPLEQQQPVSSRGQWRDNRLSAQNQKPAGPAGGGSAPPPKRIGNGFGNAG